MFAKIWKKLGIVILVLACLFNITNKLVHKISLTKELEALKQLVTSVTGANPDTRLNTTKNETTQVQNTNQLTNTANTTSATNTANTTVNETNTSAQNQQINQITSSSSLTEDIKNIMQSNTLVTNETAPEANNSEILSNSQDAVVVQIDGVASNQIDDTVYGNN